MQPRQDTQTPPPAEPSGKARRLRVHWSTAALTVATTVGVLAALHLRPDGRDAAPPMPSDLRFDRSAVPAEDWRDPADMAQRPIQPFALVELETLPDDITMPADFLLNSAVQRELPGLTEIKADFQAAGDVGPLLEAACASLAARGWAAAFAQQAEGIQEAEATLYKDSDTLNVRLHRQGAFVNITVVVRRTGQSGSP